ncbi:sulfurtransferase TusA family protein [Trichlorobacter ammonificans]|uniref:SirA family protein n=1 Tax=Trichlorobacter ammonificans TaxID=2916410 RepID=A0ABM9D9U5_9BACT|nr:sulfurtransferase TusA family protein [Trichlorobacter ammonificans]CAH2031989.1 SirA family protein [Trichlorobacter ammonificans]
MTTFNLDITGERCPMTFVKAKLLLEKLAPGDTAEILLKSGEPLDNVPRTATEQGYVVVETLHVRDDIHKVIIRKP